MPTAYTNGTFYNNPCSYHSGPYLRLQIRQPITNTNKNRVQLIRQRDTRPHNIKPLSVVDLPLYDDHHRAVGDADSGDIAEHGQGLGEPSVVGFVDGAVAVQVVHEELAVVRGFV